MTVFTKEANSLNPDTYLELFEFDATSIGSSVFRYTNTPVDGTPIVWKGYNYYPFPFEMTNLERRADGSATARPTLSFSAVPNDNGATNLLLNAVRAAGDLIGTIVRRYRTFYKFTDNGSSANSTMHFPMDQWIVIRKIAESKNGIQLELSHPLDRPGLKLPRKQILTDPTPKMPGGFPGVARLRRR